MSKEFEIYCAGVFSWEDKIDKNEIELHRMTWDECKDRIIEILNAHTKTNLMSSFQLNQHLKMMKEIKEL